MLSYQPTFRVSHNAGAEPFTAGEYTTHYAEGPTGYLVAFAPHAGQEVLRQVFSDKHLSVMCADAGVSRDSDAYRVLAAIVGGADQTDFPVALDQALAATTALCRWSECQADALVSEAAHRGELVFAQEA